jgi:hypothetical protein
VDHDDHRRREARRQVADDPLESLDAAGRRAKHDHATAAPARVANVEGVGDVKALGIEAFVHWGHHGLP